MTSTSIGRLCYLGCKVDQPPNVGIVAGAFYCGLKIISSYRSCQKRLYRAFVSINLRPISFVSSSKWRLFVSFKLALYRIVCSSSRQTPNNKSQIEWLSDNIKESWKV